MNYTALVVAAGSGSRVGLGYNKLLYKFANGETIIERTLAVFHKDPRCKQIVLVTSGEDMEQIASLCARGKVVLVSGGRTRQESVHNGLRAVCEEHVLIHDGARPWLSIECINSLLQVLESTPAALLMVPVKDTIKQVCEGVVKKTLERSELMQAQTPQAFATDLILHCYRKAEKAHVSATDDASLVELFTNQSIQVVMGDYENSKVTTKEDLIEK